MANDKLAMQFGIVSTKLVLSIGSRKAKVNVGRVDHKQDISRRIWNFGQQCGVEVREPQRQFVSAVDSFLMCEHLFYNDWRSSVLALQ